MSNDAESCMKDRLASPESLTVLRHLSPEF